MVCREECPWKPRNYEIKSCFTWLSLIDFSKAPGARNATKLDLGPWSWPWAWSWQRQKCIASSTRHGDNFRVDMVSEAKGLARQGCRRRVLHCISDATKTQYFKSSSGPIAANWCPDRGRISLQASISAIAFPSQCITNEIRLRCLKGASESTAKSSPWRIPFFRQTQTEV